MRDENIIELFWRRDEDAIKETERKYGGYCHRIAWNVLGNSEDAEECVNDTWWKVWNSIPENRPSHFQGFLAKIARHIAIDKWKRQATKKRGSGTVAVVLEELEECVSGSSNVEAEYEYKELSDAINRFVRQLPEKEQNIFVWRYFYLEPVQEIAKRLHLRNNNVSVILTRIREKCRKFLAEEGFEV